MLGLIRFFHAIVPAPRIPVLWHPLLLLNHVTILSTVAYVWEQKRPPLTRLHWWTVLGGLLLVDVLAIALVASRRGFANLALGPQLIVSRDRGRALYPAGLVGAPPQPRSARSRPKPHAVRAALADRL